MTTKLFFDTEFTGLHKGTTLISIGIVSDCGKTFYAEMDDYDKSQVDEWLQTNVIDKLRFKSRPQGQDKYYMATRVSDMTGTGYISLYDSYSIEIQCNKKELAIELFKWLHQFDQVEMWGDCLAYDWVLFCDIFGGAMTLPKNVYYLPMDLCTLFKTVGVDPDISREKFCKTVDLTRKHNALWDAEIIKQCYERMML